MPIMLHCHVFYYLNRNLVAMTTDEKNALKQFLSKPFTAFMYAMYVLNVKPFHEMIVLLTLTP